MNKRVAVWIENWLSGSRRQTAVVNGVSSDWKIVERSPSGVCVGNNTGQYFY